MHMHTLHARLKAACEHDLGRETPVAFPRFNDETFAADYFLYNLLRKEEPFEHKRDVPSSVLRSSLSKFVDSEWRCRVMNICGRFTSPIVEEDEIFFREAIRLARSWISATMMERWPNWDDAHFTSGASRNSSKSRAMSYLKSAGCTESGKMSGSRTALAIVAREIAPTYGIHWPFVRVEAVDDCRFDFVHKTAKSVRFMALQPEYDLLAQKCVGDCVREALLEATVDLNDQRWNQELAYHGSINRGVATIDLSNSSDNVAMFHGEQLLPERVFDWCMSTRASHVSVGAVKHRLEKLAPMGNGFIFEIQSLIYAGLAYAVTRLIGGREHDVAVYGDDIVISTECAVPLMDLLIHLGMEPNYEKSYWGAMPFRESCGKHYYAGRDVTPFYVKKPLVGLRALFRAVNGLLYWQQRTGLSVKTAIKLLVAEIPKKDRLVVPQSYSIDCGLHFAVSGCTFPKRVKTFHGDLRYEFQVLTDKVVDIRDRLEDYVVYRDWLDKPPQALVGSNIWGKLQQFAKPSVWRKAHGDPRSAKSYSCVVVEEDGKPLPPFWAGVTAGLADSA